VPGSVKRTVVSRYEVLCYSAYFEMLFAHSGHEILLEVNESCLLWGGGGEVIHKRRRVGEPRKKKIWEGENS
jgi:hypothetical protein